MQSLLGGAVAGLGASLAIGAYSRIAEWESCCYN
jgi:hypothetical protein